MILQQPGQPLSLTELSTPEPSTGQVLVKVKACAVCRTDLHVVDGELTDPKLPLIPGHEIVGTIAALGSGVDDFNIGERVGIPWLGWTCGHCPDCQRERENLCRSAKFTGYTLDGGYAEYTVADARFCFRIPEFYTDAEAAPLLCAGLIGHRSLVKTQDAQRLGIFGFGAAGHIVAQVATYQGRSVYAFTRPDDTEAQRFAASVGVTWAGDSTATPPAQLDAAIIFAPVGALVPAALRVVKPGGIVVCGGIHMSDIPSFPYRLLWEERTICSVANLTRRDGHDFLALAPRVPVRTTTEVFSLARANDALNALRSGELQGAAVLVMN